MVALVGLVVVVILVLIVVFCARAWIRDERRDAEDEERGRRERAVEWRERSTPPDGLTLEACPVCGSPGKLVCNCMADEFWGQCSARGCPVTIGGDSWSYSWEGAAEEWNGFVRRVAGVVQGVEVWQESDGQWRGKPRFVFSGETEEEVRANARRFLYEVGKMA